jgi:hypothetical protein
VQALNAILPMLVTLLGMTISVKPWQLVNALSPMLVTLSGITKCPLIPAIGALINTVCILL